MKIPRLLQAVLVLAGVYFGFIVVFDILLEAVIPSSLLAMYMFFVVAGVFMVFTYDEEQTQELVAPDQGPGRGPLQTPMAQHRLRHSCPAGVGGGHIPADAAQFRGAGGASHHPPRAAEHGQDLRQAVNLLKLENPFRKLEKEDPEKFAELVPRAPRSISRTANTAMATSLTATVPTPPASTRRR